MIKGVVFDFDHTLYDRDATYENMLDGFMAYFADYLRSDVTAEEVLRTIQNCDRTGIYKDAHWEGIYRDTLESGIFARNPSYEVYYAGYIKNSYPQAIKLYDDTISTLDRLRGLGYRVGILTNGPSAYQHAKVERVGLDKHVDVVVVGGDLPDPKPHRDAFQYVCDRMGCSVEESVYVGDNPINDVDGPRKAGMIPIWFRSVGSWIDGVEPAEYAVDVLGEIPDLLAEINREKCI